VTAKGAYLIVVQVDAQRFGPLGQTVERVGDQSLSDQVFAWLNRSR
jgi:hypothetical protein